MARYSPRQVGGLIVTLIGLAIALTGLVWNPWMARLWRGESAIDYREVLFEYAIVSVTIGLTIAVLGVAFGRRQRRWLDRATIVVIVLGGSLVFDRWLLTRFNLPWWRFDTEIHYVHREGAVRVLRPGEFVRINSLGFHDDEFPRAKPEGEFRGLMLGDSVTMGYGLTYQEAFSHRLEELLQQGDGPHESYQIINAGVHGYSTSQELVILRRSLDMDPDFVAIGFCMNDIPEPLMVDQDLGGTGFDYHGVTQSKSEFFGYLSNETGFGRLLQSMAFSGKWRELEKRAEVFRLTEMASRPADDPKFKPGWDAVLGALEEIYATADQREISVVLLIFPFAFQLVREDQRRPQQILRDHAERHGVACIDFTELFEKLIYDDEELLALMRKTYEVEEIEAFHRWKIEEYFIDHDHFTAKGHDAIAKVLFEHLREAGW